MKKSLADLYLAIIERYFILQFQSVLLLYTDISRLPHRHQTCINFMNFISFINSRSMFYSLLKRIFYFLAYFLLFKKLKIHVHCFARENVFSFSVSFLLSAFGSQQLIISE